MVNNSTEQIKVIICTEYFLWLQKTKEYKLQLIKLFFFELLEYIINSFSPLRRHKIYCNSYF